MNWDNTLQKHDPIFDLEPKAKELYASDDWFRQNVDAACTGLLKHFKDTGISDTEDRKKWVFRVALCQLYDLWINLGPTPRLMCTDYPVNVS